jgi:VWFA-related protein
MRALAALLALSLLQASQPPQPPIFRGGTNIVQIDAVVTDDGGGPVADLTADDFAVFDEGKRVSISAFKFINTAETSTERYPVRDENGEEREASRDDTRLFAILLDEYHVSHFGPMRIRDVLTAFIRGLGASDLAAAYFPMESPRDEWLTYDREPLVRKLSHFEGRLHEYIPPKWPAEEEHLRQPRQIERLRTQVVFGAATAIISHLGALKTGRKTLVWVTEGVDPSGYEGGATAFRGDLDEVIDAANRNSVSIYPVDPRGLTTTAADYRQDILREVAFRTGAQAIVNTNMIARALAEMTRQSRAYYLLGFESPHPSDGKFHAVTVKTTRAKVKVSARTGYWSLSEAEVATSRVAPVIVPAEVNAALTRLAEALRPATEDVEPPHHVLIAPAPRSSARIVAAPTFALQRGARDPEPVAHPAFTRSQRVVVRAPIVGGEPVDVTAQLLDRFGRPLTALPVTTFGGSCDIPLTLGSFGPGDYVVHLVARRGTEQVEHYAAFRVNR